MSVRAILSTEDQPSFIVQAVSEIDRTKRGLDKTMGSPDQNNACQKVKEALVWDRLHGNIPESDVRNPP